MQTTPDTLDPVRTDEVRAAPLPTPIVDEASRSERRICYPASAVRGPLFETRDRIALAMATVMLLGPLAALPLGMG